MVNALTLENIGKIFLWVRVVFGKWWVENWWKNFMWIIRWSWLLPLKKTLYPPHLYIWSSLYIPINKQQKRLCIYRISSSFCYLDTKSPQNALKCPRYGTFKSRKRDNIYCEECINVSQIDRKTNCIVTIYLIFTYFLTLWN